MKKCFFLLVFACIYQLSFAQEFLITAKTISGNAQVVTLNGKTIDGKITSFDSDNDRIVKITIKDSATGEATKLKAEEIKSVRIKMDLARKAETLEKQVKATSLFTMKKAKSDEAFTREFVYYYPITYPGKTNIYLSEVLNPDFSSKIQVYEGDAKASEGGWSMGGISLSSNNPQNYIVVINGVSSFVKKKKYKTEYFDKMFATCTEMTAMSEKEADFSNFAKHIYQFDKSCK
jgi:hypothetical protein